MFKNFMISGFGDPKLYLFLATIAVLVLLNFLARKKVHFSIRVLSAMAFGVIVGLIFGTTASVIRPIGQLYVRLIQMIVIPLISASIIKSFTSLEDTGKLKKIGLKSLFWLLITTGIGSAIGIVFGLITNIGSGAANLFDPEKVRNLRDVIPFENVVLDFFPTNIVNSMANAQVLPVIVFSLFISVAMIVLGQRHPQRVKPVKEVINSFADIMIQVTKFIMRFTPYGVFGLMAHAVGRNNIQTLKDLLIFVLVVYGAMLFHFVIVQMGLIAFVAKLNPLRFIKKVFPAQVVAFTSQSSYGTLPVTIESLRDRVGVSDRIAGFVAPIGANIGMNACGGIYPAIVAIFAAHALGIPLDFSSYLMIIIITMIASIGIAGVPGIATVATSVVLLQVYGGMGINDQLILVLGLVAGVDALIDMGRTMVNVTGTMVAATLVAKSEKEFDQTIFNSDSEADFEAINE